MAAGEEDSFLQSTSNADQIKDWQADLTDPSSKDASAATNGFAESDSPENLLRRLSIVQNPRSDGSLPHTGPDILHPGTKVSGRIISVMFCVPHKIHYRKNADWVS